MKFYIITGEPSGDLHAANLVEELKKFDITAYPSISSLNKIFSNDE